MQLITPKTSIPPLLGDGKGGYRIQILGGTGAGKTTLALRLSKILGIPHIPLDELFWEPGWTRTPREEFKSKISKALERAERQHSTSSGSRSAPSLYTGWITDGNYFSNGAAMITEKATDVIWLDPPFILSFWRVFVRTMKRLVGAAPPCSAGCDENIRSVFFSRDSILMFCIRSYSYTRAKYTALMQSIGIPQSALDEGMEGKGSGQVPLDGSDIHVRKMRRIGGWGGESSRWVCSVEEMVALDRKTS